MHHKNTEAIVKGKKWIASTRSSCQEGVQRAGTNLQTFEGGVQIVPTEDPPKGGTKFIKVSEGGSNGTE